MQLSSDPKLTQYDMQLEGGLQAVRQVCCYAQEQQLRQGKQVPNVLGITCRTGMTRWHFSWLEFDPLNIPEQ